jgi:hypothetical protein
MTRALAFLVLIFSSEAEPRILTTYEALNDRSSTQHCHPERNLSRAKRETNGVEGSLHCLRR